MSYQTQFPKYLISLNYLECSYILWNILPIVKYYSSVKTVNMSRSWKYDINFSNMVSWELLYGNYHIGSHILLYIFVSYQTGFSFMHKPHSFVYFKIFSMLTHIFGLSSPGMKRPTSYFNYCRHNFKFSKNVFTYILENFALLLIFVSLFHAFVLSFNNYSSF